MGVVSCTHSFEIKFIPLFKEVVLKFVILSTARNNLPVSFSVMLLKPRSEMFNGIVCKKIGIQSFQGVFDMSADSFLPFEFIHIVSFENSLVVIAPHSFLQYSVVIIVLALLMPFITHIVNYSTVFEKRIPRICEETVKSFKGWQFR